MQQTSAERFGAVWWGVWQQYVAPGLPPQGHVVDLGCGPGGLFRSLRAAHPDIRITGVEVQPAMLRAVRELAPSLGAEVIEADLGAPLPLGDGCADAVTAVMVLHEMLYPVALLRESFRILQPGGALLVYDWARQPLREYSAGADLDPDLLQHFREHCQYTPDDLGFLCESAGFHVREVIGRRANGFAMVAATRPA